jgi:hypothetical protein
MAGLATGLLTPNAADAVSNVAGKAHKVMEVRQK